MFTKVKQINFFKGIFKASIHLESKPTKVLGEEIKKKAKDRFNIIADRVTKAKCVTTFDKDKIAFTHGITVLRLFALLKTISLSEVDLFNQITILLSSIETEQSKDECIIIFHNFLSILYNYHIRRN